MSRHQLSDLTGHAPTSSTARGKSGACTVDSLFLHDTMLVRVGSPLAARTTVDIHPFRLDRSNSTSFPSEDQLDSINRQFLELWRIVL